MRKVVVAVDTNILCQFGSITNIRWQDQFPDTELVVILIVPKVYHEMDNHKTSQLSYLSARADEFSELVKQSELYDYRLPISSKKLDVELHLVFPVPTADLHQDLLSLNRPDALIVAQALHAKEDMVFDDYVVLSDDTYTLWLARSVGLKAVRPHFKRTTATAATRELSDAKREVARLTKIVGAAPKLHVRALQVTPVMAAFDKLDPSSNFEDALLKLKRTEVTFGKQISEVSAEEFVRSMCNPNEINDFIRSLHDLGVDDLRQLFAALSRTFFVEFEIANIGNAYDEDITAELILDKGFEFADRENRMFNPIWHAPPHRCFLNGVQITQNTAPLSAIVNGSLVSFHRDEHYDLNPDWNPSETDRRLYRCKQLRHGEVTTAGAIIRSFVRPDQVSLRLLLKSKGLPLPKTKGAKFNHRLVSLRTIDVRERLPIVEKIVPGWQALLLRQGFNAD